MAKKQGRKRRISGKQAKRHAAWGHQIYKRLRWDDFTLCIDYFVDMPPKVRPDRRVED
jgi:hypothetical protein